MALTVDFNLNFSQTGQQLQAEPSPAAAPARPQPVTDDGHGLQPGGKQKTGPDSQPTWPRQLGQEDLEEVARFAQAGLGPGYDASAQLRIQGQPVQTAGLNIKV
ncbi:MAG: hypothetical protein JRJ59_02555 [Deltaproteobacteria bacterium]|nr:hypothetical protein [Deltaproteobacteria bacterium]